MKTRLYLYSVDQGWELQRLYNTAEFSERLDEELDTGNVQTITSSSVSFEDCCMARLTISDAFGKSIEGYFCGFDTIEKRGGGYFIHSLDLCEPTRLLMGVFIDGRRITQPLEETQKKKLYEVVKELLTTCETLNESETERFTLDEDSEPIALMKKLVAPEFHWEAGTSLWECLCDIANVINCIPRLVVNDALTAKTAFSVVVFDKVNEIPQTRTADWGDIEGEGTGSGTGGTGTPDPETPDPETPDPDPTDPTDPDTGETGGSTGGTGTTDPETGGSEGGSEGERTISNEDLHNFANDIISSGTPTYSFDNGVTLTFDRTESSVATPNVDDSRYTSFYAGQQLTIEAGVDHSGIQRIEIVVYGLQSGAKMICDVGSMTLEQNTSAGLTSIFIDFEEENYPQTVTVTFTGAVNVCNINVTVV